jgi:nucleotide-binding universal stress UspA family protein
MFQSLMVPLDGSAFSEQALPLALRIARRANAELNLAIVRATLPLDAHREHDYLASVSRNIASASPSRITRSVLSDEIGPLEYPPPPAATVAEVLVQHAQDVPCDLIVITTHGRGGIRRRWLGSVARTLMRIAPCPVIAIRPNDDWFTIAAAADRGIRHIVVPLDGSESAERVIPFARQLGQPFEARYTLVRVASPIGWHAAAGPTGSPIVIDAPSLSRDAAQHYLDTVAAALKAFDVVVATQVLNGSSPTEAILEYALVHGADMIAVTTTGAGGIGGLRSGRVADRMIRRGDVPVLVCNVRHISASGTTIARPASTGAMVATTCTRV